MKSADVSANFLDEKDVEVVLINGLHVLDERSRRIQNVSVRVCANVARNSTPSMFWNASITVRIVTFLTDFLRPRDHVMKDTLKLAQ